MPNKGQVRIKLQSRLRSQLGKYGTSQSSRPVLDIGEDLNIKAKKEEIFKFFSGDMAGL